MLSHKGGCRHKENRDQTLSQAQVLGLLSLNILKDGSHQIRANFDNVAGLGGRDRSLNLGDMVAAVGHILAAIFVAVTELLLQVGSMHWKDGELIVARMSVICVLMRHGNMWYMSITGRFCLHAISRLLAA